MIEVSEKIISYLKNTFGESAASRYLNFINEEPAVYIRANLLKVSGADLTKRLFEEYNILLKEVEELPGAFKVLKGEEIIGKTLEHICGYYYIQGLSSMIPASVLKPNQGNTVLDACSAPGSKTTQMAEMMNNKGKMVVNEIQTDRIKTLVYNLERMNILNAGVLHLKAELLSKIYHEHFDKILVDAPCSGLGIIQKKGEVSNWWSLERVERLSDMQLRILISAIKTAKVGGEIVYSTCTLTPEENELIINKVLSKYPVELCEFNLSFPYAEAFTSYQNQKLNPSLTNAKRILPWEINSDGFFIVKLIKTSQTELKEKIIPKQKSINIVSSRHKNILPFLKKLSDEFRVDLEIFDSYSFVNKAGDIFFFDSNWNDDHPGIFERIGTKLGMADKYGNLVLHTQGAQIFSKYASENFFEIENREELKIYLEGGTIKKSFDRGKQCIVRYKGITLGSAGITPNGIKSRFPRAKRTQDIIIV